MRRPEVPTRVGLTLFFLTFCGFGLNLAAVLDVFWLHQVLTPPPESGPDQPPVSADAPATPVSATTPAGVSGQTVERLKQSILNIRVARCDGQGENTGTGFVVRGGFVATAAHVVEDGRTCGARIRLIDYRGLEHAADLRGFSQQDDLAVLGISDTALPPLDLADSGSYENNDQVVRLVTIGYPLEGLASSVDRASISGQGNISQYDRNQGVFITSGLNLNPGNSGGPIFILDSWKVVGIAVAKVNVTVGEGIAIVMPMKKFERFFREKTGQELRS